MTREKNMSDEQVPELNIEARHELTGEPVDLSVLEETDTAYDPTRMHLDLTKAEKRRTTALMMAIQAYQHLIIKDAEYLRTVADLARRDEGPKIKPATMDAMVEAAIKFDMFIDGKFVNVGNEPTRGGAQAEAHDEAE